jgi:putative flippase GtrA
MISHRFTRFLLAGGVAAIVNLTSRFVLNKWMSFEAAVAVAYLFGLVTAYTLTRLFVFDRSGHAITTEFRRFIMVNIVSLALVWSVSVGLALYLFPWLGFRWHSDTVAHVIGVASPAVISYYAHRHYTFRVADTNRREDMSAGS